jgi:predicted RNase H-like HicB family nuclease
MTTYTAVIQRHGEWWIGWVEEVPGVNSQGQTRARRRQTQTRFHYGRQAD